MSLISLLFENPNVQMLLATVALLFMFYAIGRIIQTQIKYNKSNIFISIPIGLIAYMILNQLIYTPIILTGLGVNALSVIDTLKGIGVLLFIAISYEAWMPKFSIFGLKSAGYSILSISIVFIFYIIFAITVDSFAYVFTDWIANIDYIKDNGVYEPSENLDTLAAIINNYQSTYYWIYINSYFTTATTTEVVNKQMASLFIIAVTLSFHSSFINHEKSLLSVIFSTILAVFTALILGFISPTNDMFYTVSLSIILYLMLYDYIKRSEPSEKSITISLTGSIAFITIGANSFLFTFIFGIMAITLTAIRGGNIVRNTIHFLLIILAIIIWFIFALFIYDLALISTALVYLLVLIVIFSLLFLPLYSIGYTQSRREELVSFEKSIKKRIYIGIVIAAVVFTTLSLFINWVNELKTIDELKLFFSNFNQMGTSALGGLIFYLAIIVAPVVTIIVLRRIGYENHILSLFVCLNILFNPIALTTMGNVLNIGFTTEVILVPSIMLLIMYPIGELVKAVPQLH